MHILSSLSPRQRALAGIAALLCLLYLLMGSVQRSNIPAAHAAAAVTRSQASFSVQPIISAPADPTISTYFVMHMASSTTVQEQVRVSNTGTAVGSVALYPVDAGTAERGGVIYRSQTDPRSDVGAWITLSAQQVTLLPGASQSISLQIAVPVSATAGVHMGAIVVENVLPTSTVNNGPIKITIQSRHVVAVQVDVPGPALDELAATAITPGGHDGYQSVLLGLSNTGNTMLTPTGGSLTISDTQGHALQHLPVTMGLFLPHSSIQLPIYMQKQALSAGSYSAALHMQYGHGKVLDTTLSFSISSQQVQKAFQPSDGPLKAPSSASTPQASMPLWQLLLVGGAAAVVLLSIGRRVYRVGMRGRRR